MRCPNCKTKLISSKYLGFIIYECPVCKGKWFGGNELIRAFEKKDNDVRWMDFSLFAEYGKKYTKKAGERLCPQDNEKMNQMKYYDSKVIIDKCERCGGVWLDDQEFEKIASYLEKLLITESVSDYAKEAWKHFIKLGTKHDAITSEIQDFLVILKLFQERLLTEQPWINSVILTTFHYVPYN